MIEIFELINTFINSLISYMGIFGPIICCILIIGESFLPVLPLSVFITLNCITFGNIFGYILSWIFTCLGCYLSYKVFNSKIRLWFDKKIKDNENINKFMDTVENASVAQLAMLVAIPFTPSSFVNAAAGLSNMNEKKFIAGICIGKIFMVYFWGFIGTNLIQSLTNPIIMVRVVVMVIIAYLVSQIVTKKFNL